MIGRIMAGVLLSFCVTFPALAGELMLTVSRVRSDEGAVMVGVYDSEAKFGEAIAKAAKAGRLVDKDRLIGATMRARMGELGIGFDIPPGRYGIIVFHDENDDGRLDKDMLGIPTEGYGFSNNARGFFSAPSFEDAAVTVGADVVHTVILLDYPGTDVLVHSPG